MTSNASRCSLIYCEPTVRNLITSTFQTDDSLTKPFSVEELLARLRVTQRRLSYMTAEMLAASSVFVNGKLKVGYARGCAYLDGRELHLTPIEDKLLCLLSKNVGKVLIHAFIPPISGGGAGETIVLFCESLWQRYGKSWSQRWILPSISRPISVLDTE